MPIKFNAPQTVTPIGKAVGNLVAAFGSGPTGRERATADFAAEKANDIRSKRQAAGSVEDIFNKVFNPAPITEQVEGPSPQPSFVGPQPSVTNTLPPAAAEDLLRQNLPSLAGALAKSGQTSQIGNLFRAITANAPGVTDTQVIDRAQLGAGDSFGSTIGGSREKNAADFARNKFTVENRPVNVSAGGSLFTPQGAELGRGRDTKSTAEAAAIQTLPIPDQIARLQKKGIVVSPDGTVSIGGSGNLSKPTRTGLEQQEIALTDFEGSLGRAREVAGSDSTLFGATGLARGAVQGVQEQASALNQAFGEGGIGGAVAIASQELEAAGLEPDAVFDPSLTDIDQLPNLLAYQAASAIAAQTGRGLSDKDFAIFKKIVGDPKALLSSQNDFLRRIDNLEAEVQRRLGTTRDRLSGQSEAPIVPAATELTIDINGKVIE